jgi:hypothetical protein
VKNWCTGQIINNKRNKTGKDVCHNVVHKISKGSPCSSLSLLAASLSIYSPEQI